MSQSRCSISLRLNIISLCTRHVVTEARLSCTCDAEPYSTHVEYIGCLGHDVLAHMVVRALSTHEMRFGVNLKGTEKLSLTVGQHLYWLLKPGPTGLSFQLKV